MANLGRIANRPDGEALVAAAVAGVLEGHRAHPPEEAKTIDRRADKGETPGWDIDDSSGGQLFAVEVKSTAGPSFLSIELTANEWRAAESEGVNYRLALVADVAGTSPRMEFLDDPFNRVTGGEASVEPVVLKFEIRNAES